jgi:hypothetical protein
VPETWAELNISLPLWTKIFKALGIYDEDYHDKYRKHIREKRYGEYIERVTEDLQDKIYEANLQDIKKKIKEQFPEPEYTIRYPK